MFKYNEIPQILKNGKMTLRVEPFFIIEYEIQTDYRYRKSIEIVENNPKKRPYISPDYVRARVHTIDMDETREYACGLILKRNSYDFLYDIFCDGVYQFLRYIYESIQEDIRYTNLKTNPATAGFFSKLTYDRIMHGEWAMRNVTFECEGEIDDEK